MISVKQFQLISLSNVWVEDQKCKFILIFKVFQDIKHIAWPICTFCRWIILFCGWFTYSVARIYILTCKYIAGIYILRLKCTNCRWIFFCRRYESLICVQKSYDNDCIMYLQYIQGASPKSSSFSGPPRLLLPLYW